MRIIADLHFHSRFSRACSPDLTIPNLAKIAAFKGVQILGTGDFTHPQWMAELKKFLRPVEPGLYATDDKSTVRFIFTSEISSIYKQGDKTRRVHTVVVMPSMEAAEKFNAALKKRGANLASDGRPIVGIPARELAVMALEIESKAMVVPAHIWTPWFAMFGSMSGFDSVEECFGDIAPHIFAVEMGMSSDAGMNWRVANLDRMALLASSDSHSLHRIGREGNVFDLPASMTLSYDWVYNVIKKKDPARFLYTVKYYPEEGRYHYDGHAACHFSCKPAETKKLKGMCPKCGRTLTVGVLARVEQLADRPSSAKASPAAKALEDKSEGRPEGYKPKNAIPTKHLVPLEEVIADALGKGVGTKTVQGEYESLVRQAGGEFQALLDLPYNELTKFTKAVIVEGIKRNREEKLHIEPGYDGQYGKVQIFTSEERAQLLHGNKKQEALF
jgi:uncharacterized protein (TIGR00375 family)